MEITQEQLMGFRAYLQEEERSAGTIDKYMRDVRLLKEWLAGKALSKE